MVNGIFASGQYSFILKEISLRSWVSCFVLVFYLGHTIDAQGLFLTTVFNNHSVVLKRPYWCQQLNIG